MGSITGERRSSHASATCAGVACRRWATRATGPRGFARSPASKGNHGSSPAAADPAGCRADRRTSGHGNFGALRSMLRLTVIADARFTAPALLGSSYLASRAKLIDPLHSMGRPCRGEEAPAQLDGPTVVFDEKGKLTMHRARGDGLAGWRRSEKRGSSAGGLIFVQGPPFPGEIFSMSGKP